MKAFIQEFPEFKDLFNSSTVENVIKLSNGDVRKLLLDIYLSSIDRNRANKPKKEGSVKGEGQKVSLFHGVGKYLYAKRYDTDLKKDRPFTKEELELNPPFYFDPVRLLEKMGTSIKIFEE